MNGNLYTVDLQGDKDEEFDGQHPTLVIQMKEEERIYMVIPFTSYTKERWSKLKKHMCCRVKSTNSIARIDKIEFINVDDIGKPWKDAGEWLEISKEDLEFVCNKALEYVKSSFNKGLNEHNKYVEELTALKTEFEDVIVNENIANSNLIRLNFENDDLIITISYSDINKLSINDIYYLFNKAFENRNYKATYDNKGKQLLIKVEKTYKKVLTIKDKYGKVNATDR